MLKVLELTRQEFDYLFLPLYESLQRRILMMVRDRDQAFDLTQDAFVSAWRARETFDGREPRAWLFRIGTRLALNSLRRTRVRSRMEALWRPALLFQPETDPDLWAALGRLRHPERAALLLHVLDGYSYLEVAEILDVAPGTAGSLIARAKEHLKPQLDVRDARRR